jgi:hypothetical protein
MGLKDLEGKRTGRRKGGRNRPVWERDILQAYKNVGKPDAVLKSEGARYWQTVARERPSEFAAALAQLDRVDRHKPEASDLPPGAVPGGWPENASGATPTKRIAKRQLRAKTLFLPEDHLRRQLSGEYPLRSYVTNLPHDFRVVACDVDRTRRGLVLTLLSGAFPEVAEGEAIPELAPQFTSDL